MATKQPAPAKIDSNMRVPMQSVVVQREGKMMSPPIGEPFQFTKEELDQIEAMNPDAVSKKGSIDVSAQPASPTPGSEEV